MKTDYEFVYLPSVVSTQDEVRSRLQRSPVVVASRFQTAGRGRRGAEWVNADDAMALSVGFRLDWLPAEIPIVTLIAGVAVVETLEATSGVQLRLKWPNDIVDANGNKVGGILTESDSGDLSAGDIGPGGAAARVVIGIGLNLAWSDPPAGMSSIVGRPLDPDPKTDGLEAGGLDPVGRKSSDAAWLDLGERIAVRILDSIGKPGEWPRKRYRQLSATIGSQITWQPDGLGLATDVDDQGGLMVATEKGEIVLRSGTVWSVSGATLSRSPTEGER